MGNSRFKFRAWDKEAKQMSDVFALFGEFTLLGAVHCWQREILPDSNKGSLLRLNDLVVMQYTGLKDKNGVEIYEGDVVQWFPELGCSQVRMGTLYEGDDCSRTGWIVDDCFIDDTCEVLGNIYQHPELIKEVVE